MVLNYNTNQKKSVKSSWKLLRYFVVSSQEIKSELEVKGKEQMNKFFKDIGANRQQLPSILKCRLTWHGVGTTETWRYLPLRVFESDSKEMQEGVHEQNYAT